MKFVAIMDQKKNQKISLNINYFITDQREIMTLEV